MMFFISAMLLVMRILIHNGLSIFATWLTLATVLGFTIALIYVDSPGMDSAQLRGKVLFYSTAVILKVLKLLCDPFTVFSITLGTT